MGRTSYTSLFPRGVAEDAEIEILNVEPETLHSRFARTSLLSYHYGLAALGRCARSDLHGPESIKGSNRVPSKKQNVGKIASAGIMRETSCSNK
jgi:hypothetical protein